MLGRCHQNNHSNKLHCKNNFKTYSYASLFVQGEVRLACRHQRIDRQLSQPFTHGSFEGKTIHTEARYVCNVSGLEIWAPWPPDEHSFHFLRLRLHCTVQYPNTEVCLETGSTLAEISQRFIQADLPNGKRALPRGVNGSVQNSGLSQLQHFFTQADSP